MNLDELINHTGEWLKATGPYANIVMSTRIRLARNLARMPFPNKATPKNAQDVLASVEHALKSGPIFKNTVLLKLNELDNVDRQLLVERHLMSHDHAASGESKALVFSPEEELSIMVNEEDHLRIQLMQSGFNLKEAWNMAKKVDDELTKNLEFAFLKEWGYLTACPTNTGTAMRGSVMLHLPALVMTKQINKVLTAISKLSFASRGFYGEGTQAIGNFYQISNQVSLGHSEEDIIQNITGLIRQVIEQEEQARQAMLLKNRLVLEDKLYRAQGVLRHSRIISSQETIELLSMVRLGIDVGIVKDVDRRCINDLFIMIQPAHLQKLEGKKLTSFERDVKRASLIRQKLGGSNV